MEMIGEKMRINADLLKDFVTKASLNGSIMSINLDFAEEGLKSAVKDTTDIALTITSIGKDSFEEYSPMGEIFIKNSSALLEYLDRFEGNIEIEKLKDYLLYIYDDRKYAYILLGSELVCENVFRKEAPTIDTNVKVIFNKEDLITSLRDARTLKVNKVTFDKKGNVFTVEVGTKEESDLLGTIVDISPESTGEGSIIIGPVFESLYASISGEVVFSYGNGTALVVECGKDRPIQFKCIIAPRLE
jgi:hypothetical protein